MAEVDRYGNGVLPPVSPEKPAGAVGTMNSDEADLFMQDGWPVGEDGLPDLDGTVGEPGIAQVELEGDPRYRAIEGAHAHRGDEEIGLYAGRVVRIVAGYGPDGDMVFQRASDVPFHPADLPHVPLAEGEEQDIADQGINSSSLTNTRKKGASSPNASGKIR